MNWTWNVGSNDGAMNGGSPLHLRVEITV